MSTIGLRRSAGLDIAFFGSSLVSAYWNGAATYYRGIIKALHERGHRVTFYEPDAYERQQHRDIPDPAWARVVVYNPTEVEVLRHVEAARDADVLVKASGVGVHDALLERAVIDVASHSTTTVFWDVDAPATLASVEADPRSHMRALIPRYDMILTYGGGAPVVRRYTALGAAACIPIYNALDPDTHYPTLRDARFECDLAFLGNRLPDREARVEQFFLRAAECLPERCCVLGGSGWDDKPLPGNVRHVGHVYTADHNAFNSTPLAVLNISRESMASTGFSPATRLFEAAGARACIITDAWEGIERFLEPGEEVLVAQDGDDVVEHVAGLDRARAESIGQKARRRVLAEHTYERRAAEVEEALTGRRAALERSALRA
jgi:spore maturation protein CgeB